MAITSVRRIPLAQEFVRLGFGDMADDLNIGDRLDDSAVFHSQNFVTQELTTTELQAVLPLVKQFNNFSGDKVAAAIERFRGRVIAWRFGRAGSPLLIADLPYWTHQIEDTPPRAEPGGSRIDADSHQSLIAEMRQVFLQELDADLFEPEDDSDHTFRAWWD
jgi:hypothetical protein